LPDSDSIDWRRYELSTPRSTLLPIIHRLRQEYGYEFSGFSDWDIEELMEKTGLDGVSATLASQRDYTEPLLWRDTADRFDLFKMQLGNYKLRAVQGGRFISVMGHFDKLDGMRYLIDRYQQSSAITTLALGDSPNDEQMLNAADIAVVIKSPRSNTLIVQDAGEVIYTDEPGPVGWQKAMEGILGGHT